MDLATDLLLLMTLEILEVNIVMRRVITDIVIPLSGCMQYIAGMVCMQAYQDPSSDRLVRL
jgi:hypothetical protein